MNILIKKSFKSIPAGLEFTLPRFSILTGRNGSGKTHLLEAIASNEIAKTDDNNQDLIRISYIEYNKLNYTMEEHTDISEIIGRAETLWREIESLKEQFKTRTPQNANTVSFSNFVFKFLDQQTPIVRFIKETLSKSKKKGAEDLTLEDIHDHLSFYDESSNTTLEYTLAAVFKTYHVKWSKNLFKELLSTRDASSEVKYLSEDDFINIHGPAPWELINKTLEYADLPYHFPNLKPESFDLPYQLNLVDRTNGKTISINDLSSGEKVLMSLAVSVYSTKAGEARPQLLLLDEPDAPLHPCYSKLLIEILQELIVKEAGINVIMTTHSPATVALAPEECLFEVQRNTKKPIKLPRLEAVAALTKGLSNLRVSYEKRRTVFVESNYDVEYYETLFRILSQSHDFSYEPIFMPPHSRLPKESNQYSSNCKDVINIVKALEKAGNDLSWGIIDYDNTNNRDGKILVIGEGKRYSIENYLLDPLYVFFGLIRAGKNSKQTGLQHINIKYTEISKITESQCQEIINELLSKVGYNIQETEQTCLLNGYKLYYPSDFLRDQGHDYETKLFEKFAVLKELSKGQTGPALKRRILLEIAEHPQFLPTELLELFRTLGG